MNFSTFETKFKILYLQSMNFYTSIDCTLIVYFESKKSWPTQVIQYFKIFQIFGIFLTYQSRLFKQVDRLVCEDL